MTLTIEQFNKLITKDDAKNFVTKEEFQRGKNEILSAIDGLAKQTTVSREEKMANREAHNRIQGDINEVRKHVGLNIKHPTLSPEAA